MTALSNRKAEEYQEQASYGTVVGMTEFSVPRHAC